MKHSDVTGTLLWVVVVCSLVEFDHVSASVGVMKVTVSGGRCLSPYGPLAADQSFNPPGDCARITCDAENEMLHIERCIASNKKGWRSRLPSDTSGNRMVFPDCCLERLF
nr:uncharacterized protein LOC119162293 [Rhipicephalus microplus]